MRDIEGEMRTKEEEVKIVWKNAWYSLGVKDEKDKKFDIRYMRKLREQIQMCMNDTGIESDRIQKESVELDVAITKKEVQKAIDKLRNGKATGQDEIHNELLKYGGEEMLEILWFFFNQIWSTEILPAEWGRALVIPLYRKGDKHDPFN